MHLDQVKDIKKKANSYFSSQNYADAIQEYTAGIDGLTSTTDLVNSKEVWDKGDDRYKEELVLLSQLLNNRAQCNIKLGNFKEVLKDTATVIHICSSNQRTFPKLEPWNVCMRKASEYQDMYLKAQLRRVQALLAFGNTGKAAEHIFTAACPPTLNSCYSSKDAAPTKEAIDHFSKALSMTHPDTSTLATTKLDWSLIHAGTWTPQDTKGDAPPASHFLAAALHGNKIYVACGQSRPSIKHNAVFALDLSTLRWLKVNASGTAPPTCSQPSTALWGTRLVVYSGGPAVHTFNMAADKWERVEASAPPSEAVQQAAPFVAPGTPDGERNFAIAVSGDTLYVFGGVLFVNTQPINYNVLLACDLNTGQWAVEFDGKGELSWDHPCARYHCDMWATGGKLYVLGGRMIKNTNQVADDVTLMDEDYFWTYDLAAKTWRNEGSFLAATACRSNAPAGRSEFALAVCGQRVVVHGGYTTALSFLNDKASKGPELQRWLSLADTFVYDVDTGVWRTVFAAQPPPPGAGGVMVHVPPSDGKGANRPVPGKVFLLGGYIGGEDMTEYKLDRVWALKVESSMKKIKALCWGCGQPTEGLRQCAGACGGSVVVCGVDCHKKVWQEQHRSWCHKVD